MNPFLADLYNTADNIGAGAAPVDDAEKLAQATIIDQMLRNEGKTIDSLTSDDVVKVAAELFGPDSPLVKEAMAHGMMMDYGPGYEDKDKKKKDKKDEEKDDKEKEKEAQEKLAEADFMGRQMAHAYVSELRDIEKKAEAQNATQQAEAQGVPSTLSSILNKQAGAQSGIEVLAQQKADELIKQAEAQPTDAQAKMAAAVDARTAAILKERGYQVG